MEDYQYGDQYVARAINAEDYNRDNVIRRPYYPYNTVEDSYQLEQQGINNSLYGVNKLPYNYLAPRMRNQREGIIPASVGAREAYLLNQGLCSRATTDGQTGYNMPYGVHHYDEVSAGYKKNGAGMIAAPQLGNSAALPINSAISNISPDNDSGFKIVLDSASMLLLFVFVVFISSLLYVISCINQLNARLNLVAPMTNVAAPPAGVAFAAT
jgi:hypothetical protein